VKPLEEVLYVDLRGSLRRTSQIWKPTRSETHHEEVLCVDLNSLVRRTLHTLAHMETSKVSNPPRGGSKV